MFEAFFPLNSVQGTSDESVSMPVRKAFESVFSYTCWPFNPVRCVSRMLVKYAEIVGLLLMRNYG